MQNWKSISVFMWGAAYVAVQSIFSIADLIFLYWSYPPFDPAFHGSPLTMIEWYIVVRTLVMLIVQMIFSSSTVNSPPAQCALAFVTGMGLSWFLIILFGGSVWTSQRENLLLAALLATDFYIPSRVFAVRAKDSPSTTISQVHEIVLFLRKR